jgi:hypothetical protein
MSAFVKAFPSLVSDIVHPDQPAAADQRRRATARAAVARWTIEIGIGEKQFHAVP